MRSLYKTHFVQVAVACDRDKGSLGKVGKKCQLEYIYEERKSLIRDKGSTTQCQIARRMARMLAGQS